jgi:hypothetical protein
LLSPLSYCDLRQDYFQGMVAERKQAMKLLPRVGGKDVRPGCLLLDMALRTFDEAAALGMAGVAAFGR